MKKSSDNYNLSKESQSGMPGFDLFRDEDSLQYFFHFNDKNGVPILFSEGYSTAKGQKNAVRSVKSNVLRKDRYNLLGDTGAYYFTLKAGNNIEIARSKLFRYKRQLNQAIKYLKKHAGTEPPQKESINTKDKKLTRKISTVSSKVSPLSSAAIDAPKYSFRIDLYPEENKSSYRGRIVYLLNEDYAPLNGLEMKRIEDFIQNNLPAPKNQGKLDQATTKTDTEMPMTLISPSAVVMKENEVKVWKNKIGSVARQENLRIKILGDEKNEIVDSIPVRKPFFVSVNYEKGSQKNINSGGLKKPFRIELKLKNLEQQLTSPLASYEVDLSKPGKNISPFKVELPTKGMYRLIATVPANAKKMAIGSILVAAY